MNDLSVQFDGVSKRYPHFSLENIHLELPTGSIMGFIGANGAGKSTTIRILMGLVHQDEGSVRVLGHPMPADQAAAKLDIGFVSDLTCIPHHSPSSRIDAPRLSKISCVWYSARKIRGRN